MLTPLDIKNKEFKGALGYKKREVDVFMTNILDSYETLYKTNKDLDEKNNVLASKLASYKTIEQQLEKSLILAQKAAEDVRNQAREEANVIEQKARLEAKKIVEDAKNELVALEKKIEELALTYEKYKAQVKSMANAQIELMDSDAFKFERKNKEVIEKLVEEDFTEAVNAAYKESIDEVAASDGGDNV